MQDMSKPVKYSFRVQMIGPIMLQILVVNSIYACRYSESRQNFLYSCDGSGCGKMLIEFHSSYGLPGEVDMFIVTTVLQYLVLRKQIVAAWTLKVYTENHPSINRQDYCFCVKFNICAVIHYYSSKTFLLNKICACWRLITQRN